MGASYSFGEWVKKRRKALDLTQEDLAQCVGCSLVMIRKVEQGERRPSAQIVLRLAACLHVPDEQHKTLLNMARGERPVDFLSPPAQKPTPELEQIGRPIRVLPAQLTHFVGRASELAQIGERLLRPDCRLLTLTGPGGIGKSRLAIQTAQQVTGFADGVFYVPLAPILSPAYLSSTIAEALDITVTSSNDPQAQLVSYLSGKNLLLILDNFDHLLDGTGLVVELLKHAPHVRMLVTSRERLYLKGEWLFSVEGMNLPLDGDVPDPQRFDAIRFFHETAQRIKPDFALADHWHDVVRICTMVEGNPLGIELAAAQLHVLSCREVADRLATNLDLLSSSLRDVPERHRSMRSVMEHSWNQLLPPERDVLARLSVFRGGFTADAAEKVGGGSLQVISNLIDKSLVRMQSAGRFTLHELLRQYVGEKLAEDASQVVAAEQRHSGYYTDFLHRREAALCGSDQLTVREEIDAELQNIHAAWQRALDYQLVEGLEKSSTSLMNYYNARGKNHEGLLAFSAANQMLETASQSDAKWQRALLLVLACHSWFQLTTGSHTSETRNLCERSLELARSTGWKEGEAFALCMLGLYGRTLEEAEEFFQKSLTIYETGLHGPYGWGLCYVFAHLIDFVHGKYDQAAESFRRLLRNTEAASDFWLMCVAHLFLGKIALLTGSYEDARYHSANTLDLARVNSFQTYIVTGLIDVARLACWKFVDFQKAKEMLSESVARQHEIGFLWVMPTALTLLGNTSCELGEYADALSYFRDAFHSATMMGNQTLIAEILNGYGLLLARTGAAERALDILVYGAHRPFHEHSETPIAHRVALQEIMIRIEDTMARLHLDESSAILRRELEAQCGLEVVASALKSEIGRSFEEMIPELSFPRNSGE